MSGEIDNHLKGIWRSFIIYERGEPTDLLKYLETRNIKHSWQRYTEDGEPHHISIRIEFSSIKKLQSFRRFVNTRQYEGWMETSWDEKTVTKRAYEFGSYIFRLFKQYQSNVKDLNTSNHNQLFSFIGMAFHCFFNELDYDYYDEMKFYVQTMSELYPYVPSLSRYLRWHRLKTEECTNGKTLDN